jgi:AsmA protein
MGKPLKIIFSLFGLLLFILLAAALVIPLVVNPNEHKETIASEVKKATGRDLTINGDIALSIFPWLGLDLGSTQLSNAAGFGESPFIALNQAQIRIKLLPLFSKQLVVDTIVVDGLRINLSKNSEGTSNWEDMIQHGKKPAPSSPSNEKTATEPPTPMLAIEGISISNADLLWDDKFSGKRYEIKGINLKSGGIKDREPTDLSLDFSLTADQPAITAKLHLTGIVTADLDAQKINVEQFKINSELQGEGLPKGGLKTDLIATLILDHAKDTIDIQKLILNAGDLHLVTNIFGLSLTSSPVFEGDIELSEFNPRKLMTQFAQPLPVSADPSVFNKFSLKTNFRADTKNIALSNLAVTFDQSRITGQFKLLDFTKPSYRFKLKLDEIDADRYLPPPAKQPGNAAVTTEGSSPAVAIPLIPIETLRSLDTEGEFAIDKLKINNIQAQFLNLFVQAKAGKVHIDQTVKRFYGGSIKGRIKINVQGQTPRLTIEEHASKILAEPLIKDVADIDILSGVGSFNANLTTQGQTIAAFKQHLAGKFNFTFNNGALKGINIAQELREAKAKFSGKRSPTHRTKKSTDFSQLSASARIEQGIMHNSDLLMKSPFLRITGKGKVDLVTETLNYLVRPVVVTSNKGEGGKELKDLAGIPIPVKFKGPWRKPDWEIDMKKILVDSKKDEAMKKVEETIKKKLGDDPRNLLKKLF